MKQCPCYFFWFFLRSESTREDFLIAKLFTNQGDNPDVLGITLTNLQQDMTISNFNDLSSDHNPILITINKSPKTNTPLLANRRINWKKFKAEMTMHSLKHQAITNPKEIEDNIEKLTKSIQKALSNNSSLLNQPNRTLISPKILLEIETKRILRKRWQQTRDPTYKKMYNAQINYVKKTITDPQARRMGYLYSDFKFRRQINL